MSEISSSLPITSDVTSTIPPKKSQSRGSRGQGSAQRNQDRFRERKGAEFMAANQKRLDARLGGNIDDLIKSLEKINVRPSSVSKQLPITTRGLGLTISKLYPVAQSKQPDNCTVFALYRASLAQFELQVRNSRRYDVQMETAPRPEKQECDFTESYEQTILSRAKNFQPVSSIINSYGHFQLHASVYHPFVPVPFIKNQTLFHQEATKRKVTDDKEIVSKEVLEVRTLTGFVPDPYVVTLSNLRTTVEYLHNGDSDIEVRRYFYEHNPLPGAIWQPATYILMNPDDIAPIQMGKPLLIQDLDMVENWLARFKGKVPYANGTCSYDGKGNVSQILMSRNDLRAAATLTSLWVDSSESEDYYSPEALTDQLFFLGVLHQFGEYPHEFKKTSGLVIRPPDIYASRHHSLATLTIAVDWDTVVMGAINR